MKTLILPRWQINSQGEYTVDNEEEVLNRQSLLPPPEENHFFQLLPLDKTVITVFLKFTIEYNSQSIELTSAEIFSLCIGINYQSSFGVVHTIEATPSYFTKIERVLDKHFIKSGNRYILPKSFNMNGEIIAP